MDRFAAGGGNNDIVEIVDGGEFSHRAQKKLPRPLHEISCRDLLVGHRHSLHNVLNGEVVPAKAGRIDFHLDLAFIASHQVDGADARDVFQAFLNDILGVRRDVLLRTVPGDGQLHDRKACRIVPRDNGILNFGGKVCARRRDLFPHLLRSNPAIHFQFELDDDNRQSFLRRGLDVVKPADRVHRIFDLFRHIRFDLFGSGPPQHRGDRNVGNVHVGELVDVQFQVGEESQHDERKDHHRRKDRAFYRDISEFHRPSCSSFVSEAATTSGAAIDSPPERTHCHGCC